MAPPREIPKDLRVAYTMNGKARVKMLYYDSAYTSDTPLVYTREIVDKYIKKARAGINFYYKKTDACLYKALSKYSIEDQEVVVMGSTDSWYEAVALAYGAKPTTIEYNKIISLDPRLTVTTNAEFERKPRQFDAALAISSFEHDGLGRYGDPPDPDGDIHTMKKMKTIVKPGGLLFLALPVGHDTVVWNAHRVYGHIRLARLLEDWKIIDFFGVRPGYFQPVIVLENSDGALSWPIGRVGFGFLRACVTWK
jgi:SAM-dependent methyltransferase